MSNIVNIAHIVTVQSKINLTIDLMKVDFVKATEFSMMKGRCFVLFRENEHCYEITQKDFNILSERQDMLNFDLVKERLVK